MDAQLEQIRDQQKETWNKFSPGWKKWDEYTMSFIKPAGDAIMERIAPKPGDIALDVAAGTGEPGLTIATMVGSGKVMISDLADGMLNVAREKAAAKNIKNCEFIACDVSEMPFADNTFDIVSCRYGFMFFPDMLKAAKEINRVLKPGGRVATSVWGLPEKNPWATIIMDSIKKFMEIPAPPPGAPGLFRCGKPGSVVELFNQAGFKNVNEKEIEGIRNYNDFEFYWTYLNEVVAPVVAAMSKADDATKAKIKSNSAESMKKMNPDGGANLNYAFMVISATK